MACMLEQLIAFAATSLVVIVVPGPDMMLTLRNAARGGRAGAFWTAAGIMTGLATSAIGRNPEAAASVRATWLLGAAFAEGLGVLAIVVGILAIFIT